MDHDTTLDADDLRALAASDNPAAPVARLALDVIEDDGTDVESVSADGASSRTTAD